MMLSGCSTTSPGLPPSIIEVAPPERTPPVEYLVSCEEDLPQSGVPEDVWGELTPDQRLRIILNVSGSWAREYHQCATRQRALVSWHLKERDKADGRN
jgi:hypothetical protein